MTGRDFYERLSAMSPGFSLASSTVIGPAHGFRVEAGQTFRFVMVEGPQILDVDIFNADDPSEHYAAASQIWTEGAYISRFTHIWGTPPRSRPLATVTADTVKPVDNLYGLRDHKGYGAHCNPHHWLLFSGMHPHTCYDNLRAACAMVGLGQRAIHDNLNLFQKSALDPYTGRHITVQSDAVAGDYLEFFAELPLLVAVSVCPYGDGGEPPSRWSETTITTRPVRVEIYDTGVEPFPFETLA